MPKEKNIERENMTRSSSLILSTSGNPIQLKKITAIRGEGSNRSRWLKLATKRAVFAIRGPYAAGRERRRNKLLITLAGGCGMIII